MYVDIPFVPRAIILSTTLLLAEDFGLAALLLFLLPLKALLICSGLPSFLFLPPSS